jgi:hypothetical protein
MFTPIEKKGTTKYGAKNNLATDMLRKFNLSQGTKAALGEMSSYGLAKSTWSTYKTAQRMLATCGKEKKRKMELPLQEEDILEFIGWLASERKVKAGTMNSYLAGIRQLHILKGMEPPVIHTSLVKFLLQGRKNMPCQSLYKMARAKTAGQEAAGV